MSDKSKPSDSGTYSRKSSNHGSNPTSAKPAQSSPTDHVEAKHENRFAEVTRKSREARSRLNAATQARSERSDAVERDRDYARGTDEGEPSAVVAPRSAVEKASAVLGGDAPDEEGS